nr:MAG TPA: hypothetical protein [Caudoviricetes sp.]
MSISCIKFFNSSHSFCEFIIIFFVSSCSLFFSVLTNIPHIKYKEITPKK